VDTRAEAVERAVRKLTRLGQIGRESAANDLPITGVTNRDGLNIAATLHALLIERDTYRRELQATSQQADMLMAALDEWRDEPPGGIIKGGVLYLSPERVAAELKEAVQRGDDWCDQVQKIRAERDMWRAENAKKVTACEQMGARITALEAERNVERENAETLDAICQRTEAERDEAVATLALYRMKNGCTRGQRTTQWCGEATRLRAALQDMLADREAWQIGRDTRDRARAALKETGHE
jgi:hypothetical protein